MQSGYIFYMPKLKLKYNQNDISEYSIKIFYRYTKYIQNITEIYIKVLHSQYMNNNISEILFMCCNTYIKFIKTTY